MYRIGIDLSWMRTGKVGGVEQATYGLVKGLAALDHHNRYNLYCPRATYWDWDLPAGFRHQVSWTDRVVAEQRHRRDAYLRRVERQPESVYRRLDLLHAPSGYLPDGAEQAARIVVTIHDLQQLHMPEFFTSEERDYRAAQLQRIVAQADHLLCISAFT